MIKQTAKKVDLLFNNKSEAMNWARKQLGHNTVRTYNSAGKWTGWSAANGDKIYFGHGDWGKGVGSSTFPHLNYNIVELKDIYFFKSK